MEKDELEETNGENPPAVGKPEGDAFAVRDEDWEKQSEGVNNLCNGNDSPELGNEHGDTSENKMSSQVVEKVEGDAFSIQNEDQRESREVKIQNVGHDGHDEQDDLSHRMSSQAVENLEGDASTIQNEDHDKESKEVVIQNDGHDGPGFDKEPDDISDKMDEVIDVTLSTHEEVIDNLVGESELDQSVDESRDLQRGPQEKQPKGLNTLSNGNDSPELCNEHGDTTDTSDSKISSQVVEKVEEDAFSIQNEDQRESREVKIQNVGHDDHDEQDDMSHRMSSQAVENLEGDASTIQNEDHDKESKEVVIQNDRHDSPGFDKEPDNISDKMDDVIDVKLSTHEEVINHLVGESELDQRVDESRDLQRGPHEENLETSSSSSSSTVPAELFHEVHESNSLNSEIQLNNCGKEYSGANMDNSGDFESKSQEVHLDYNFTHIDLGKENNDSGSMDSTQKNQKTDNTSNEDRNSEPVFDGKEVPGVETIQGTSTNSLDDDPGTTHVVERAVALTNFVRMKSVAAVSAMLHRLSRKMGEASVRISDDVKESEPKDVSEKEGEKATQNPLNLTEMSSNVDVENRTDQREELITEGPPKLIAIKGRIILYTRLGCQESKEVRQFLYMKRLRYVEINIDVYPSRKMELEKISGSISVPKVFFNEIPIGGISELKILNESGMLDEKIGFLITEAPPFEGPFPPLSGEDDLSTSGAPDEMALIARKMKESIVVRDRFSKMRRFTNCFLGSEAVDFLSEDQYLERKEAVEFGRKLASKLFFRHVLDENLFEDGNYLYRFLDDDPIVASQCHNIPRGIITVKPKPITEVASRLRFLSYAMFEAYASEDGRHVDYRSMHGSEEFARYLRVSEELQRVEMLNMSREERLAFFINLYNMMTIHAILVWGHPAGALERRKLFGDFKYVISASTYSLSAVQNGILRANQRPPYSLMRQFGAKDKRAKMALSFSEPLIHFALVCGTRSGPALRCYSPGDIDKELMDAARDFLRSGGLIIDFTAKVAYASKILKWFSVDFGKNEVEVLKHVSNYLDPAESELLLDLLATSELKVIYQPYDWGLNC